MFSGLCGSFGHHLTDWPRVGQYPLVASRDNIGAFYLKAFSRICSSSPGKKILNKNNAQKKNNDNIVSI